PPSPPVSCPAYPPPPQEAPPVGPGGGGAGFDNAFDPPPCCPPPPPWHADFTYLGWWTKHEHLPPLVTTGSPADLVPGALGQPNTVVLSPTSLDDVFHTGGRVDLSYEPCGCSLGLF